MADHARAGDGATPELRVVDLMDALERAVRDARTARTPVERWGTCCPHDPECEHSFLDGDDLTRWMDKPITDAEVERLGYGAF